MYAEGQTLKITATENNSYRSIIKGGTLTVTVLMINDNNMSATVSDEDAKMLGLRPGRNYLSFDFEPRAAIAFYPEWTIEVVDAELKEIPDLPATPMTVEQSKSLAEKLGLGWTDPRDTGAMVDQPQPAQSKAIYTVRLPDTGWERSSQFETGAAIEQKLDDGNKISVAVTDDSRRSDYIIEEATIIDSRNKIVEYLDWNQVRLLSYFEGKEMATTFNDLWPVMTAGEARATFGLAEATVRQAINRNTIPARLSGGTWIILRKDAVARWGKK